MTHDELLAKINNEGEFLAQHFDCKPVFINALRAVVELHKPHITLVNRTTGATRQKCRCEADYPCPTIQAVTDNLK